ncbi:cuticle protein AMP1A-like [Penaeus chinensis]|uniref:cuticle protein AMP1A-like n=1 Tax=Penaeus chinensis TaxID=139456 RepID=UPI001FB64FE4|nr:cuticle protein AMP1A-like [Penaeus chinensis]
MNWQLHAFLIAEYKRYRLHERQQYLTANMKFLIIAAVAAVATAVPQGYGAPPPRYASSEEIAILRDDRVIEDDGRYNFDMETANGIVVSEHGTPGEKGAINSAGSFSYTAPDGTDVHLQFVADENGFQPQGAHLPVAPAFPHPIPQFVLDQIAFAAEEDARNAKRPSGTYGAPQ